MAKTRNDAGIPGQPPRPTAAAGPTVRTAVVTGPSAPAGETAAALQGAGFDAVVLDGGDSLAEARARLRGRVDCYVGLPGGGSAVDGDGSDALRALLTRLDALAVAAPLLSTEGIVVIVIDPSLPVAEGGGQLWEAVRALTDTAAGHDQQTATEVRILDAHSSAIDIAAAARPRHAPRSPGVSLGPGPSLADVAPSLGYAEWRDEILSLSTATGATYHGSIGPAGRRAAVVARGTVVSPLWPAGVVPPVAFSWGDAGPGTYLLAGRILVDLLGTGAACPACETGTKACPLCLGSGLSDQVAQLVGAFVEDVVRAFPRDESFELSAADVRAWIGHHRRSLPSRGPPMVEAVSRVDARR